MHSPFPRMHAFGCWPNHRGHMAADAVGPLPSSFDLYYGAACGNCIERVPALPRSHMTPHTGFHAGRHLRIYLNRMGRPLGRERADDLSVADMANIAGHPFVLERW